MLRRMTYWTFCGSLTSDQYRASAKSMWMQPRNSRGCGSRYSTLTIQGTPCFREGKVVRVNHWLASHGWQLSDFRQSFFYSDSMNDVPLLEAVTDPIAANPSAALRELARERGWRITDLFA